MTDNHTRPLTGIDDLAWLLDDLVKDIRHCHAALLLSSDGINKFTSGLDEDQAKALAASISGLFSLAQAAGQMSGSRNVVRQLVIELDDRLMFVTDAGTGAVLSVITGREADVADVGFAMTKFTSAVGRVLATPERPATM